MSEQVGNQMNGGRFCPLLARMEKKGIKISPCDPHCAWYAEEGCAVKNLTDAVTRLAIDVARAETNLANRISIAREYKKHE